VTDNSTALAVMIGRMEKARGVKATASILQANATSEEFSEEARALYLKTLKYAYDRNIRFGINVDQIDFPESPPTLPTEIADETFQLLDEVRHTSSRSYKLTLIERAAADMSSHARSILYKILSKDLRCGINESSINKAFPDLLTQFSVMLAKPFAPRLIKEGDVSLVEPKLDGLRAIAEADTASGEVSFYTRSGKSIDSLDNFKSEVLAFAHQFADSGETVVFDGEVTSGTFLESMGSVRSSSKQMEEGIFHVFDVLVGKVGDSPIGWNDDTLTAQGDQWARRQALNAGYKKLQKHLTPTFIKPTSVYRVTTVEEIYTYYNACRDAGLEGVIIKNPTAPYVKKRSASWLKIKAEETEDLPIVGAFEGEGRFVGMLGGWIVRRGDVDVRVGSGFSDDQRKEFWEAFQDDLKKIERGERDRCRVIDVPAETQYQEVMPSGSLRHPVFVRLRYDKHNNVETGSF
jgi:DNA ligase-1